MRLRLLILLSLAAGLLLPFSCDVNPYKQGKVLYEKNCQNCHQEDGKAVATLIPPLVNSEFLPRTEQVACIIRNGLEGEITVNGVTYNHQMPANKKLSSIQIANIINYIRNAWGNEGEYASYDEIEVALENCK